jgi:hypothetical protein
MTRYAARRSRNVEIDQKRRNIPVLGMLRHEMAHVFGGKSYRVSKHEYDQGLESTPLRAVIPGCSGHARVPNGCRTAAVG